MEASRGEVVPEAGLSPVRGGRPSARSQDAVCLPRSPSSPSLGLQPPVCSRDSPCKRLVWSRSPRDASARHSQGNKGWPLAEPRPHSLQPPVWQHDTKAAWRVYTFQAEPLFRGGCSLRVMGPLQTKPASFLIKPK